MHEIRNLLSAIALTALLISGCAGDDAGNVVTEAQPVGTPGAATETASIDFPQTFRGTGTIRVTASSDFGSRGSATGESTADFEITLTAGGLVTGTYVNHLGTHFWCGTRDGDVTLDEGSWELSLSGTHDFVGSFTMSTLWGETTGSYSPDSISAHSLLVETFPPGEICSGTTHLEGELDILEMPRYG